MPAPDAVWVSFEPEERTQHWSLLGAEDKVLCDLPCARWVSADTGAFLQYDRPGTNRSLRVSLPASLGPPGGSIVAIARPGELTNRLSTKLILGGISLTVLGVILFGALDNLGGDSSAVAVSVSLGLGVPLLAAGIYLRVKGHPADVALRTASVPTRATFTLGPGFVALTAPSPAGPTAVLTPFGAAGTF